jgi:hypothetical protein
MAPVSLYDKQVSDYSLDPAEFEIIVVGQNCIARQLSFGNFDHPDATERSRAQKPIECIDDSSMIKFDGIESVVRSNQPQQAGLIGSGCKTNVIRRA